MAQKKKNNSLSSNRRRRNLSASTKTKKCTKKTNQIIISNTENVIQISHGGEEGTQKFNLSRCQHKKKKQICKGKSPSTDNTQQMEFDQAMRIHFHEEIMMDILSRLPVRSLLRFKCVSKFWKSLIVDPYFKWRHYIQSQNSQKLLIAKMCLGKDDVYSFYFSSLSSVQVVEDEQKLDWPLSCSKPEHFIVWCSCDGLVLIFVSSRRSSRRNHELWLWNPATRESILLPNPEFGPDLCVYGLAYDATSDNYKILAVKLNEDEVSFNDIPIELFSLKSGSWRRIGCLPGIRRVRGFRDCGMDYLPFLHGAFHWLGRSVYGYYTTISFNISNEVYGEIPLLKQMYDACHHYVFVDHGVSVFRGMLCFYSTYNYVAEGTEGTFQLWVMKDYGVTESWIKLIKIQGTDLFCSGRPKYMFADGHVLLHCKHRGCVSSKFTTSRGPFGLCPQCKIVKQGIVYAESFISPKLLT